MNAPSPHDAVKELIAAYVLGALPEDEVFLARTHILSCDECLAEAERYSQAVAALSFAADPATAPGGLADTILESLAERAPDRSPAEQARRRILRSRLTGTRPLPALAALVAVIALVTFALLFVQADARLDRSERVLAALVHADGNTIHLRGQPGAVAKVVPTPSGAYLVASGIPPAAEGRDYQLWLLRDGKPISAGLFDGSDRVLIFETSADFGRSEGAAITLEPAGGSSAPTTEPILSSA